MSEKNSTDFTNGGLRAKSLESANGEDDIAGGGGFDFALLFSGDTGDDSISSIAFQDFKKARLRVRVLESTNGEEEIADEGGFGLDLLFSGDTGDDSISSIAFQGSNAELQGEALRDFHERRLFLRLPTEILGEICCKLSFSERFNCDKEVWRNIFTRLSWDSQHWFWLRLRTNPGVRNYVLTELYPSVCAKNTILIKQLYRVKVDLFEDVFKMNDSAWFGNQYGSLILVCGWQINGMLRIGVLNLISGKTATVLNMEVEEKALARVDCGLGCLDKHLAVFVANLNSEESFVIYQNLPQRPILGEWPNKVAWQRSAVVGNRMYSAKFDGSNLIYFVDFQTSQVLYMDGPERAVISGKSYLGKYQGNLCLIASVENYFRVWKFDDGWTYLWSYNAGVDPKIPLKYIDNNLVVVSEEESGVKVYDTLRQEVVRHLEFPTTRFGNYSNRGCFY